MTHRTDNSAKKRLLYGRYQQQIEMVSGMLRANRPQPSEPQVPLSESRRRELTKYLAQLRTGAAALDR